MISRRQRLERGDRFGQGIDFRVLQAAGDFVFAGEQALFEQMHHGLVLGPAACDGDATDPVYQQWIDVT
ncbi:hypothetical protein XGA_0630 [Xanthomonas hortorum ATCC 19865]|nr:hypothetical protein XGA_0630 [Xanthomonas hortorum ATCC 19865]